MRLSSVEVIPYALPFKEPYVTARGTLRQREMVLLRLRDEEGVVGLGEAVPLSLRGGATLAQVVRELEGFEELGQLNDLSAPARCAVEEALTDLRGRRGDHPPETSRPVPCNATLTMGPPDDVAAEALRWAEDGFTTFKLKLGSSDDIGQVRAVREAVGPEARIRVDANEAWNLETAKQRLAALEPYEVELVEQPVPTLIAMAELAETTSIPLAADESVATVEDAKSATALGACTYTGIKLSKVGGPREALAIDLYLRAYLSSALDGPVGIAAAAQVAQAIGGELAHGLATQRLFASTIAAVECELRNGMLHLPPGPGLGVEIDEDALQAHRI